MNQYIITDEKLQQLMTRKRKNPLGEGHGSDLSLAEWEIHTIVDGVYHHPYQSDRDKVLDDIIGMFDNGNYNGITVKQMITGKFKEIELRQQAGEP
jgi:hypothetical protein